MSKALKLTIGISLSFLIIIVALALFLRHLVTKSFPVTVGTLSVEGLEHEVQIYRDAMGVPHIIALNEHDMIFAQGYVHAQDRLWQMDMVRRLAEGRVSEVLGDRTVEFDKLFRTLGLSRVAETIEQSLQPESHTLLDAYARGVNAFVRDHYHRLPVEFDVLNYRPEPWKPQHSIMVARMIAWDLAMATITDIPLAMMVDKVDLRKGVKAIPSTVADSAAVLADLKELKSTLVGRLIDDLQAVGLTDGAQWGTWFMPTYYRFRTASGRRAAGGGSNSWVVGGKRSATGKPILANDLHLIMPAPSLWYQAHLSSPRWNVAGVSLPGTPLIIVGRNNAVSWGFTNAMVDDADFFIEQMDSTLSMYNFEGTWQPVRAEEEIIHVGKDSVVLTRRSTHHGPVVDEIILASHIQQRYRYVLTMRWTGFDVSDEFRAFYLMNKAINAEEFESGVRHLAVPGQNVVYADTAGNIAQWIAARIPIRKKYNAMVPLPGWSGEAEWKGYIPFNQLPHKWNPPEGFIASANDPFVGKNFPYYVSELWEPSSRIMRIRELLSSNELVDIDDMRRFQLDILSPHGKEFSGYILQAFAADSSWEPMVSTALEYLMNWDFRFNRDNVAPTLVSVAFLKFLHNVFEDEMGDTLFRYFVTFTAVPYRVVEQLLASDNPAWFDDVTTPEVETKDEILRKSLYDAIRELRSTLGADTRLWRWGSIHTVTFAHPFGMQSPLDRVFNIGPFPLSGSGSTIHKAEFRFTDPYHVVVGASMRHVISLGDPSSFLSVITSGSSGQVLHDHYDDQTVLWLNGGYHTMVLDQDRITRRPWDHLTLKPR